MKVLYGSAPCGLTSYATIELMEKLIEQTPQYFAIHQIREEDGVPLSIWASNEENVRYGSYRIGPVLYNLDLHHYSSENGKKFRTDPKAIELFEKYAQEGFKIADVPDDIEWDVWVWDTGEESIHEKHRVWS